MVGKPDEVAEKAPFLKVYMGNHPDTLVAYAKFYGNIQAKIVSASMTDIDTKKMTLLCTFEDKSKRDVVVKFDPPLKGYSDVKPRLLEMKSLAQEGLGMIKTPQITTYEFPRKALFSVCLFALTTYVTCAPHPPEPVPPVFEAATTLYSLSPWAWDWLWTIFTRLHFVECAYMLTLVRRHTGLILGLQYLATTFVGGIPVILNFRSQIQQARIDSVMKVE